MNSKLEWPTFNESMEHSIDYNQKKDYLDKWFLAETKYNKIKKRSLQQEIIPKKIHQIWLGGPMPDAEKRRCEELQNQLPSDWAYELWTENSLHKLPSFKNIKEFNTTPNYGQKSDILRLEILYHFGGIYCDTDIIMYKPFNDLLDLDFFCGISYDAWPGVQNSVIGSTPKNQVIEDMLSLDIPINWSSGMSVINTTGPYFVTRKLFKHLLQNDNIVALPNSFLYPYPNSSESRKVKGDDYKSYVKPETYCVHLWASTWMR